MQAELVHFQDNCCIHKQHMAAGKKQWQFTVQVSMYLTMNAFCDV